MGHVALGSFGMLEEGGGGGKGKTCNSQGDTNKTVTQIHSRNRGSKDFTTLVPAVALEIPQL